MKMLHTPPNKMHVIFGFALISSLVMTASAIECYSCESTYEAGCGFDFDSEDYFKVDCEQKASPRYVENLLGVVNATGCMKRVYKEQSITKYVRSCYFGEVSDTENGCLMDPSITTIEDLQCFVCDDDDYCNTAAWSHKDRWSTLVSLLMFVLTTNILKLQYL